ncbi:receptor recognition protein [Rhizobium phage Paso]|uniref:Receptor recognition protein n=1 Tax=Rhizobium phage Paso TaxID=2767574 RepID=A0A7L8G4R8_9CAUD|nr:receptor recognition protein [Rhizobium phage Paso]
MTLHTRQSGAWAKVNGLFIRQSGVWTPVKNAYVRDGGVWKVYYSSEIVVNVTTSQTGLVLSTLFSSADWISATPKRVVIQSGVVIGGAAWGALASKAGQTPGNEWGGILTLDNYGIIQGRGGIPNSGIGGSALYEDTITWTKKCIVNNFGTIRAGGGAGGVGGAGSTSTPVSEGPYYGSVNGTNHLWSQPYYNGSAVGAPDVTWAGVAISAPAGTANTATSFTVGIYTYTRGAIRSQNGRPMPIPWQWEVSRSYQSTVATAGGTGGRGQGSDGAAAAGAAGGANAGNGGPGGNWGIQGGTGNTGNAGAGAVGGLAGIAYNTANWSMTNTGTIQGRVT